jgi:hypothetical protein
VPQHTCAHAVAVKKFERRLVLRNGRLGRPQAARVYGPQSATKACQSHYVIQSGKIMWHGKWSAAQIAAGRRDEQARRKAHYDAMYAQKGLRQRFWQWIKSLFSS